MMSGTGGSTLASGLKLKNLKKIIIIYKIIKL